MIQKFKELLRESAVYGLSSVMTGLINIFLIPLYAKSFPPEEFKFISLINVTSLLLQILIVAGMDNSVGIWYYDKDSAEERRRTFSSWTGQLAAFALAVGVIFFVFSRPLAGLIFDHPERHRYFQIAAFHFALLPFQRVVNIHYRLRRKPIGAVAYGIGLSLVTVVLAVLFVRGLRWGVEAILYAQATTSVMGFILFVAIMRRQLSPKDFDWGRMREMLGFAVPLIPATLAFWVMNSAGTYVLEHYSKSEAAVGLFQMAVNVSAVLNLFSTAFLQAFTPFAGSLMKKEGKEEIYAHCFTLYVVVMCLMNMGLFFFVPELLRLFTSPAYYGIASLVPLLGINIIVLGTPQILAIGSALMKTNRPYFIAMMSSFGLTLLLYWLLIPTFGEFGTVIAMLTGNLLVPAVVLRMSQRLLFIPFRLTLCIAIFVGTQGLGALVFVGYQHLGLPILVRIGLFLGVFCALGLAAKKGIGRLKAAALP